jgi:hypothetical protein
MDERIGRFPPRMPRNNKLRATVLNREESLLTDQVQSLKPFRRKKTKKAAENGKICLEARLERIGKNCAQIVPADSHAQVLHSE